MAAIFEIEGLSLRLGGTQTLSLPRLSIGEGERIALVGPNGSGKTSLLKVLAGLLAPSGGVVRFCGSPLCAARAAPGRIVYLHQHPYILSGSISYNVEFGARSRGSTRREAATRANDAMRLLGLEGFGRRSHRALSGGEAQRVALARAIATGSDVLLLDEPTASADAASRDLIAACVRAEAEAGSTVVCATHDEALVAALDARRLRLEGGRIAEGGGG